MGRQSGQSRPRSSSLRTRTWHYCATPLPLCRHSPAKLLMGRRLRTRFLQLPESIQPTWSYIHGETNKKFKARQKRNFDQRHRDRESDATPNNSPVWITLEGEQATNSPRSYLVETPTSTVRRNHIHLNINPSQPSKHLETQTETEKNTDTQAT